MSTDPKSLAAEIEAKAIKAQSGLLRAHELLAEKYSTWSPEAGTQFSDRYPAEAVEGIRLARELLAEIAALQSRAFEDGARWMRERITSWHMQRSVAEMGSAEAATSGMNAFQAAEDRRRWRDLSDQHIGRAGHHTGSAFQIAALPLQPEGERNV